MPATGQTIDSSFQQRALVTAGAVAILLIGCRISLPGVDAAAARDYAARYGVAALFSLFSIGVMPILSSAFILEILKLIFSRLRDWEAQSDRNATILQRVWLGLSLATAALQGYGVASAMRGIDGLITNPQGFVPLAVASFLGATALLFWICLIVVRRGLVGGLWLLFAAQMIMGAPYAALDSRVIFTFGALEMRAAMLLGAGLLAALAILALAGARVVRDDEADRAGGLVWPVILGYYTAGLAQAAFILMKSPLLAGRLAHLIIFAVLAVLITLMRMPKSQTGSQANARLILTLLQVAAIAGGSILLGTVALPFSFNPVVLVVSAAVVQVIAENAVRRA